MIWRRPKPPGDSAVTANVNTVRRHYEGYFDLLDRRRRYEAASLGGRPPIMNLGYWARGAGTAREAQEDFVHELIARAPHPRGCRVLDAGCGVGGPATLLAQDYGALVEGVNIVGEQVTWARQFIAGNGLTRQIRVHLASAMNLPFRSAAFDVVFCLEAAHCFADKPRFLREALRVLRPGGRLLFADIVGNSALPFVTWQPALGLHLVKAEDWLRMVRAAGFRIEEHQMIGRAVYPGCRRWVSQTAAERRLTIFAKSSLPETPPLSRPLLHLRAWVLEFIFCRSVLLTLSRFGMREYILLAAAKPE